MQLLSAPPTAWENFPLSLHDALPICRRRIRRGSAHGHAPPRPPYRKGRARPPRRLGPLSRRPVLRRRAARARRSEEHTSELQSHVNLVCRLLLEKKNRDILYFNFGRI